MSSRIMAGRRWPRPSWMQGTGHMSRALDTATTTTFQVQQCEADAPSDTVQAGARRDVRRRVATSRDLKQGAAPSPSGGEPVPARSRRRTGCPRGPR